MTDYQSMSNGQLIEAILEAENRADAYAKAVRQAKEELLHRKRNEVASAYSDKGSQFGIIHLQEGNFTIDITTTARVEWDQEKLAVLQKDIREQWQSDPAEYIECKLGVKEAKYKAWPSELRAKFEPARLVKASSPSISINLNDKE